jgi:hypothetical protein
MWWLATYLVVLPSFSLPFPVHRRGWWYLGPHWVDGGSDAFLISLFLKNEMKNGLRNERQTLP